MILARAPDVILELRSADIEAEAEAALESRMVDAGVGAGGPEQARDHPQRARPHRPRPAVVEGIERMAQALHRTS